MCVHDTGHRDEFVGYHTNYLIRTVDEFCLFSVMLGEKEQLVLLMCMEVHSSLK